LRNEGAPEIASKDLIKTGVFESERLVNMKNHNYALEPNVTFSPDKKWIVFRSNMLGPIHVYAVEIAKAE
jgi:oligogalacturonide lyase